MEEIMLEESNLEKDTKNYKVYKWRWMVLISYCVLSLCAGSTATSYPAVSNILQEYFKVEPIFIHVLIGMYCVTMIFFVFPFSYLLHRYELGCVLKVSAILNLIGGVIRYFGESQEYGYYFIMSGNFFSALSMASYIFLPPKLGQNWFGENEQGRVNGICIGFDMIATAIGFLHSPQIILNRKDNSKTKSDIKTLVLQQLIAAGVAMVITCVFSQSKPKTPPSEIEEERLKDKAPLLKEQDEVTKEIETHIVQEPKESDYWISIKLLFKNRDFLLICQMGGIVLANEIFFSMILNDVLIKVFPGREKQIGITGFTAVILGFISNVGVGYVIDKSKAYKKVTIIMFLLTLLSLISWTVLLEVYQSFELISLSFCLFFMCNTSYYSTGTTHMVVVTQPLPPGSSCMVLLIFASIYGSIISFTGSLVLEYTSKLFVNLIMIFLTIVATLMSFCMKK